MDASQKVTNPTIKFMGSIIEAILPKPAPVGHSLLGRVEKRVNNYYRGCFPNDTVVEIFDWVPRDPYVGHKFQKLRRRNHIRLFVQVDFEVTRHGDTSEHEEHLVDKMVEAIDAHASSYMIARPSADSQP
jgi:hypothetical protein